MRTTPVGRHIHVPMLPRDQHVTYPLRQDAADAIDRRFPVDFLSTT
jgi:hypothetical protein